MLGFSLSVNRMDTIRNEHVRGTDWVQKLGATVRERLVSLDMCRRRESG